MTKAVLSRWALASRMFAQNAVSQLHLAEVSKVCFEAECSALFSQEVQLTLRE